MTTEEETPSLKTESVRQRHHRMIFWMMQGAQHQKEAVKCFQKAMELHQAALEISGDMPDEATMRKVVEEITGVKAPSAPKPRIVVP